MFQDQQCQSARLCHLRKWTNFTGYGFHLDAIKGKSGQYIGVIDENSPASIGGLKQNDKVIEVNGENVCLLSHQEVVQKIKARPNDVVLLVVSKEEEAWFQREGIIISSSMPHIVLQSTPPSNPFTPSLSSAEKCNGLGASVDGGSSLTSSMPSPSLSTASLPTSLQQQTSNASRQQATTSQSPSNNSPSSARPEPQSATNSAASSSSASLDVTQNLQLSAQEMRERLSQSSGTKRRQATKQAALSFGDKTSLFHQL